MSSSSILLIPAALALCAYAAYRLLFGSTPLDALPGPTGGSWLLGQHMAIQEHHDDELYQKWFSEYGHVVAHKTLLGKTILVTSDLRAVQHILSHPDQFQRTPFAQRYLNGSLGYGLLAAAGAAHRAQRRVLNPAFGPTQIRELTGIFLDKANKLRDAWSAQTRSGVGKERIDIVHGLSSVTLDIIGLAGFGYDFDALSRPADQPSELLAAFAPAAGSPDIVSLALLGTVPGAIYLPTKALRSRRRSRAIMERIGKGLIQERKADAESDKAQEGRDLLSLLVRANLSEKPSQRLSDDAVLAQIPIFLIAGHETTANSLAFTLFELARRPDLQNQLRDEARQFPLPSGSTGNEPLDSETLDALDQLPLLDAVVRESLRVHSPIETVGRVAVQDTVIPLAQPFVDRHGVTQDSVRINKGDLLTVPILSVNRSKELWGPDAELWKPERWLSGVPKAEHAIPGAWGQLLTFSGGAHACIGYRFAVLETKLILHALVAGLRFELALPASEYAKKSTIVARPVLASAREAGIQLPLLVSQVRT